MIEGVLFRARYLGSTQLVCEGQPTKSTRMMQAEEAVSRIKVMNGLLSPFSHVQIHKIVSKFTKFNGSEKKQTPFVEMLVTKLIFCSKRKLKLIID